MGKGRKATTAGLKAKERAVVARGDRHDEQGWIHLHVEGSPRDRGFQHGYLLAAEIRAVIATFSRLIFMDTGVEFAWFAENAELLYADLLASDADGRIADGSGREILAELEGIVDGANRGGGPGDDELTLAALLAWNAYPIMICQWWPAVIAGQVKPPRPLPSKTITGLKAQAAIGGHLWHHFRHSCSAFVATGKWTTDGRPVVAHTTWQRFANGDAYNVVIDLVPEHGNRIHMQSMPGYVHSGTDFYVTGGGLVVTETTIDANGIDEKGVPEFWRVRRACQSATSIAEWRELFREGNDGGYVNSWLLADVRRNQVACHELTLHHDVLHGPKKSGYFTGFNIALDARVRNLDATPPSGWDNILMSGSRRVRYEQLMAEHRGKIDEAVAREIIGDHHDPYRRIDVPSSRTICGHLDNDDASVGSAQPGPFYPWGSCDGKVVTAAMADEVAFSGRWGRACGTPLDRKSFFVAHPEYDWMRDLTKDRPTRPWVDFRPHGEA
ncbi:MAG: C45 family autoproteolytic acyltransferase/hydrolase [Acidimicrobiia bacterium]